VIIRFALRKKAGQVIISLC